MTIYNKGHYPVALEPDSSQWLHFEPANLSAWNNADIQPGQSESFRANQYCNLDNDASMQIYIYAQVPGMPGSLGLNSVTVSQNWQTASGYSLTKNHVNKYYKLTPTPFTPNGDFSVNVLPNVSGGDA